MSEHRTDLLSPEVTAMVGPSAMPRDNGALVFEAPWQGRAFGSAVAAVQGLGLPWDEFREHLIAAIADQPDRPYYESWVSALEAFVVAHGLATVGEVDRRAALVTASGGAAS
jgi:nitrile hydratase accessory protein